MFRLSGALCLAVLMYGLGSPARAADDKVIGFMGEEFTQENTYADYKDMGGIKKATKLEIKRDGEKFMEQEITDFKPVDKHDAKTFDKPD